MASETVTVIQGKKAIPPNLGIWAVCNLRSSTESNRRRRKETNENARQDHRTQCPADYDYKGKFDKMKNVHYMILLMIFLILPYPL